MALEADPPWTGDIGDETDTFCRVVGHPDDCDCGVDPDDWEEY